MYRELDCGSKLNNNMNKKLIILALLPFVIFFLFGGKPNASNQAIGGAVNEALLAPRERKEIPAVKEFLKERYPGDDKRIDSSGDAATALKQYGVVDERDGGLWFNTSVGIPPCEVSIRGTFWFSASQDGFADQWLGCMKDEKDSYSWQVIR